MPFNNAMCRENFCAAFNFAFIFNLDRIQTDFSANCLVKVSREKLKDSTAILDLTINIIVSARPWSRFQQELFFKYHRPTENEIKQRTKQNEPQ